MHPPCLRNALNMLPTCNRNAKNAQNTPTPFPNCNQHASKMPLICHPRKLTCPSDAPAMQAACTQHAFKMRRMFQQMPQECPQYDIDNAPEHELKMLMKRVKNISNTPSECKECPACPHIVPKKTFNTPSKYL